MSKRNNGGDVINMPIEAHIFTDEMAAEHKKWIEKTYRQTVDCGEENLSDRGHSIGRGIFHSIARFEGSSETLVKAKHLFTLIDLDPPVRKIAKTSTSHTPEWAEAALKKDVPCGRAFTKADFDANKFLIGEGLRVFSTADSDTKISDKLLQSLFTLFRGIGEFTHANQLPESVGKAAALYEMFYEQIISCSPSTALQKAFDPSYVVLDDPLPAGLAAAVAGYPIANPSAAPVPHDGSTRSWRCANEQAATLFLGYLQHALGAGLHGWVFVCTRAPVRAN
jgi:hypothetical protein